MNATRLLRLLCPTCLLLALAGLLTLPALAQSTWTGATSTDWATASNWNPAAVPTASDDVIIPSATTAPTQPTLSSTGAVANSVEVQSGATLTIASGGTLAINGGRSINFISVGFYNAGTVDNSGTITLGNTASVGDIGIRNPGTFTNQTSGQVTIDRSSFTGLFNRSGSFNNAGKLTIGAIAGVGTWGIENEGTFDNQASGQVAIDRSNSSGLSNFRSNSTFTNAGKMTIGAIAGVGQYAIYNNPGTFTNSGCSALVNIVANAIIENTGTFTNSGQIVENASGTSSISSNTGIVVNNNGGTFTVGSGPNQPLAVVSTNATQCSPPNGSIQLTGLKASTPYTLRYGLGSPTSLLSPDSTSTASGTLTIPALGGGTYALTLGGSCVPLPITLEATLTGPAPGFGGAPSVSGASLCAGQALTVTVAGTCLGTLTAQLSDASGSFANPVGLGTVAPGQNQVIIPPATPFGTGYRIRVVSSGPALTSSPSAAFTVNALGQVSVALYPATPSSVCLGQELPVTFSTTGPCPFPLENVFTVQLSSSTGSFANPLTLGTTAQPGTTHFALPLNLPAGTGYRVRVLTSNPATTSFASAPFELRYPSMANVTPGVGGVPQGGICRGNNVTVSFTLPAGSCAFLNGNGFIAQLSSASGSFNNPVSLGAVQAGVANSVTIPAGSAAGTGYRIRVLSSNPASTSLASLPFRVNACVSRMSAEEPELVVAPNPVPTGGEIRVRVSGLDNPAFSLTTSTGRNVLISTKTDGTAEFVLTPRQALTPGLYAVTAEEGPTRITRRVLVVE